MHQLSGSVLTLLAGAQAKTPTPVLQKLHQKQIHLQNKAHHNHHQHQHQQQQQQTTQQLQEHSPGGALQHHHQQQQQQQHEQLAFSDQPPSPPPLALQQQEHQQIQAQGHVHEQTSQPILRYNSLCMGGGGVTSYGTTTAAAPPLAPLPASNLATASHVPPVVAMTPTTTTAATSAARLDYSGDDDEYSPAAPLCDEQTYSTGTEDVDITAPVCDSSPSPISFPPAQLPPVSVPVAVPEVQSSHRKRSRTCRKRYAALDKDNISCESASNMPADNPPESEGETVDWWVTSGPFRPPEEEPVRCNPKKAHKARHIKEPFWSDDTWFFRNSEIHALEISDAELNRGAHSWTLLGSGASAVVFRGVVRNRDVAIKMFRNSSNIKCFLMELEILLTLGNQDNIIEFVGYCCGRVRGIIMEYCSYGSLFDVLHKSDCDIKTRNKSYSRNSQNTVCLNDTILPNRGRIAAGIARAMARVHSCKICHLDLTSRNILVTSTVEPRLCDFGLSLRVNKDGLSWSTPHHGQSYWKAPEIMRRKRASGTKRRQTGEATANGDDYDPSSREPWSCKVDVFSYGMVLWELFNLGKFPWETELSPEVRVMQGDRPDIEPDCPAEWKQLIEACWQQDPTLRPTAQEVVDIIEAGNLQDKVKVKV